MSDEALLGYGVPTEWLMDVRETDEDGLLALAGHLPAEAAEAVLELATGGTPQVAKPEPFAGEEPLAPFTHPDAQRRFRVVTSVEELERALDAPWDKWAVFLSSEDVNALLREASGTAGDHKFSAAFLRTEWSQVVDAWQLGTWEAYRDVQRLIRRTRLPEARRAVLWTIFEQVRAGLKNRGLMTESAVFQALADAQANRPPSFDAAVMDEAQDVSIAQLRFLAALGGSRPNALFFSGDLGQRIFQQPFSWKALGVDVRGRSKTLRVTSSATEGLESSSRLRSSAPASPTGLPGCAISWPWAPAKGESAIAL